MPHPAYIKSQARELLDTKLAVAGATWAAQRHAVATLPGHPAVRRAVRRTADATLVAKVSRLLHVYLEDLDYENAR